MFVTIGLAGQGIPSPVLLIVQNLAKAGSRSTVLSLPLQQGFTNQAFTSLQLVTYPICNAVAPPPPNIPNTELLKEMDSQRLFRSCSDRWIDSQTPTGEISDACCISATRISTPKRLLDDTRHNDIWHNDTQCNDTRCNKEQNMHKS